MHDPHFTSQTKTQLASDNVQGIVHSIVYEGLLEQLRKKIALGRTIVQQAQAAAQARVAASKARSLVIRRSVLDAVDSGLPGKLADVTKGTATEQTVLYIVEGDSAGGSCKMARDRRYHAILPLRGKPLNVEGVKLTRLLSNNEIKAIIAAVGGGIGADFQRRRDALRRRSHPGRRRRGRRPHPHPALHAVLALHAAHDRGRPALRSRGAALPAAQGQTGPLRLLGPGAGRHPGRVGQERA